MNVLRLDEALSKGLEYLASRQSPDGTWKDFQTEAGGSLDWVTAFVVFAISRDEEARDITTPTRVTLALRQRPNGGWAYNGVVPTDCDSTAWGLLAMYSGGSWRPSAIRRAMGYLTSHQRPDSGGFATYNTNDGIANFIGTNDEGTLAGWYGADCSVTAATILALLAGGYRASDTVIRKALSYLRTERSDSGLWNSYWWKGRAYATYTAIRALLTAKAATQGQIIASQRAIRSAQYRDGSWGTGFPGKGENFETAFMILCSMLSPNETAVSQSKGGVEWLVSEQEEDGGWSSAPILRIPAPMVRNPESVKAWRASSRGTNVLVADEGRIFTTASVLWALTVYKQLVAEPCPS